MNPNSPARATDTRNLILAIVLATIIMVGWQHYYEAPRQKALREAQALTATTTTASTPTVDPAQPPQPNVEKIHEELSVQAPTIAVKTDRLHGSISLRGARFDNLTLAKYRESVESDAPEVKLLAPVGSKQAYFVETGMLPLDPSVKTPNAATIWTADRDTLTDHHPVTLRWDNGEGLTFEKKITIDDGYMFTVTTTVINRSAAPVTLYPFGLISRIDGNTSSSHFLTELLIREDGPIAVNNKILKDDITYGTLREDGPQKLDAGDGWIGFGDPFWLTALIPASGASFDATFTHVGGKDSKIYQADLREQPITVPTNGKAQHEMHLFAGAKEVSLLDAYSITNQIPLFDRAVNFGSLYFLTKPMFQLLSYFNNLLGNFGLAILLLTVIIKVFLFPLANKSMIAMGQMKKLTPKMQELREVHGHDKMKLHQEIAALYKREKVNPMSGCLPILIQIPIFFALYRVLSVTIEMRQAPFYGWIQDLSVADPSNIFTAFGLIAWSPPHFMHLGVLPILMCISMVIQQRFNPKPADEIQAMMINYMPYMFLIIFATLPAGLVIYSVWNNILTIFQQMYINRQLDKKGLR